MTPQQVRIAIAKLVLQGLDEATAKRIVTASEKKYSEEEIKASQQANATYHRPFSLTR